MDLPDVLLYSRKSRPGGNFSIEASFATMLEVFPRVMGFSPQVAEAPVYSNKFWPRVCIALALRRKRRRINHITGDIHFSVLALPHNGSILTVHDCGFMNHPNPLIRWLLWYFWLKLPCEHCEVITAISSATKQDILRYTGCDPAKIRIIPTIIKTHFVRQTKPFPSAQPRILHIGTAPNKNLLRHVQALEGVDIVLHVVGKLPIEAQDLLNRLQINYVNDWDLSDEQVHQAYLDCDLLLFASTLEGFGMPILEAQTVGRPVISSNLSSMPEVAGDAACLVDPYSVESIRAGVLQVISDSAYREALIAAGFENIKRFQPEAVARAYGELYQELLQKA
jgi:glycosyltransferase involved in cell wall biosynthesis